MKSRPGWNFDNSYAKLPPIFYTKQKPEPVASPKLVMFNESLAEELNLHPGALQSEKGAAIFAGKDVPEGAEPIAQAYAGHQFGHFTMLGDGRAILLGEHVAPGNRRVDIQLKGAGRTPYSRGGDGRAALGPMLREYIISEAMHALGIPTTRSLAVAATGERVIRERVLPGAVLTRVASSHIRVGTFEFARQFGSKEDLRALCDYTIGRHFPHLLNAKNPPLALLEEVIRKQASLIAKWQLAGFVHGVMNTDNMAISGETIDYGPCAFMDRYNPETVFSSIDVYGRYAYGNQPKIGGWNLARFAEALLPIIDENKEKAVRLAQEALAEYPEIYVSFYLGGMRKKLGLFDEKEEDGALIQELLQLMQEHKQDYTNTFRALTLQKFEEPFFQTAEFREWHLRYLARIKYQHPAETEELMKRHNPAVIPRNHRVEEALEAAVERGDLSLMKKLLAVLSDPYAYSAEQEEYCTLPEHPDEPYITYCGT
ncbi:protein adenylyltransferase SelO [Ureibacillus terrenus]|uniref:Protein nucleotidyltransferase YdiU n=1 Tax=Ureibacillus terrenus TaxID=118246 RepID=A0A540V5J0_9BACL|nr:YdiU family protein [Ureibacillus terrenus]TQE92030.1 YdiU family protein [Ureibacillus terrenus]